MTNKKDGPIKSYKLRMKNRVHWSINRTEEQVWKEHARIDKTGTFQSDSIFSAIGLQYQALTEKLHLS